MIIDNIANKDLYLSANPGFKAAFDFIEKAAAGNPEDGKYPIEGDNFCLVQSYTPSENAGQFEAHRDYIDIQFIVSGSEYMEWNHISEGTVTLPYAPENDCELFTAEPKVKLTLNAGDFAVFFPQDLHNPGNCVTPPVAVKKIIAKIKY